jgi:hypothetical protein
VIEAVWKIESTRLTLEAHKAPEPQVPGTLAAGQMGIAEV